MKNGVLTTYKINTHPYASYILGSDINEINELLIKRGLNEEIESMIQPINLLQDYTNVNDDDFIKCLPEILHVCCYLSFIALKAKNISIDEVLGDEGVIHEVAHLFCNPIENQKKSLKLIRDLINKLQTTALGLY